MFTRKQILAGADNESLFLWGARQTGKSTLIIKSLAIAGDFCFRSTLNGWPIFLQQIAYTKQYSNFIFTKNPGF